MLYGDFLALGIGHLGKYSGTVYLEKVKLWERQSRSRLLRLKCNAKKTNSTQSIQFRAIKHPNTSLLKSYNRIC